MQYRGRFFDGNKLHENAEIGINDSTGVIEYLEDSKNSDPRYKDVTFIPGLIDVHMHFFGTAHHSLLEWVTTSDVLLTIRSINDANNLLYAGFTTVRTLGDKVSLDMSKAEKLHMIKSPRIISAGYSLAITGGNDDPKMFGQDIASKLSYSYYCDGPWECRKAVRMNLRNGAEVTKAYASTSFVGGGSIRDELSIEELKAIVDESHRAKIKATAHAYGSSAIWNTIEAGLDSIDHGLGLTEDQAESIAKKGIYYVPTLSAYKAPKEDTNAVRDAMIKHHLEKEVKLAQESGVKIACGTDFVGCDSEPLGSNYLEIEYLSEIIGIENALKSATSIAAQCLGRDDIGVLEKGRKADMIAVRGDPLKNVSLLKPQNVALVLKEGKTQKDNLTLT